MEHPLSLDASVIREMQVIEEIPVNKDRQAKVETREDRDQLVIPVWLENEELMDDRVHLDYEAVEEIPAPSDLLERVVVLVLLV